MTRKRILMTVYTVFAYAAGIALAIWRIIFIKNHYNPYTSEYDSDANELFPIIGWIIFACVLVLLTSFIFVKGKNYSITITSDSQFSVICYALCGAVFIISAFLTVIYKYSEIFGNEISNSPFCIAMETASLILMALVGLYFFACASVKLNTHTSKKYLSFVLPLWGISFICSSYSDSHFLFTDPDRRLANTAFICVMLLFLLESRSMIGRPSGKLRFTFSLVTAFMLLVYCVPLFLLIAFWQLDLKTINIVESCGIGVIFYAMSLTVSAISCHSEEF